MPDLFAGTRGRVIAPLFTLVLVACGVFGLAAYDKAKDSSGPTQVRVSETDIVLLELAGTKSAARALVCQGRDSAVLKKYDLDARLRPHEVIGDCKPFRADYQRHVDADYWFILGYGVALVGLCLLGSWLFHDRRSRRAARLAAGAALIAALLDVAEDVFLTKGLNGLLSGEGEGAWVWAAAAAITKFALLLPALVVATTAFFVILARSIKSPPDFSWTAKPTVLPPAPVITDQGLEWPAGADKAPTPSADLGRPEADVGICVSGGGIRSASVALGALHELREAKILQKAAYLVSVSGGGYTTGALRLALQPKPGVDTVSDPAEVFKADSLELDHVRRHGRYVADTRGEWVAAMGTLLRGVVVSLGLLAGVVTVVAALLGIFYEHVPLIRPGALLLPTTQGASAPGFPHLTPGVGLAFGVLFLLALVVWLVSVFTLSLGSVAGFLRGLARAAFLLAAAVAVIAIVIPAVVWAYFRALWWLADHSSISPASAVAGRSSTVVLAYLGTLVSILWRGREKIGGVARKLRSSAGGLQRRVPTSLTQRLIVWLVLLVLALAYGALFTAVLWSALDRTAFDVLLHPRGATDHGWWPHWFLAVIPIVFLLVALLVDQTWMSLHPFYRRRLATAFAVRRRKADQKHPSIALPYDFTERTPLQTYAAPVKGMPQVIFAAAAELSGFDRTPPGRRATSFTFSHDWVGGPQVGYVRTGDLTDNVHTSIKKDLTLQSAVAVSGAAFASAMGRQARAFQTLLTLSNARLGTWLPNPAWLADRPTQKDWRQPRLPRIRRLSYLLRELLGTYNSDDRLLLVTDGGHYENLGLVELLRHRCRTVYCIDSSGDAPPLAGALGYAISLAAEELGTTITLDNPLDLVPGSGGALAPADPLAALSARLSTSVVVTGTITYPEPFKLKGEKEASATGRLIVAKTRLTGAMPAELLTYAQDNPVFPHDSTSDQWFDEGQFNAYYGLGRYLGKEAAAVPPVREQPGQTGVFSWLAGVFN